MKLFLGSNVMRQNREFRFNHSGTQNTGSKTVM